METVKEVRAVSLVRAACSELSMAVFEWTIADGFVRSNGSMAAATMAASSSSSMRGEALVPKTAVYNTTDPVQALANMESMSLAGRFYS